MLLALELVARAGIEPSLTGLKGLEYFHSLGLIYVIVHRTSRDNSGVDSVAVTITEEGRAAFEH